MYKEKNHRVDIKYYKHETIKWITAAIFKVKHVLCMCIYILTTFYGNE